MFSQRLIQWPSCGSSRMTKSSSPEAWQLKAHSSPSLLLQRICRCSAKDRVHCAVGTHCTYSRKHHRRSPTRPALKLTFRTKAPSVQAVEALIFGARACENVAPTRPLPLIHTSQLRVASVCFKWLWVKNKKRNPGKSQHGLKPPVQCLVL